MRGVGGVRARMEVGDGEAKPGVDIADIASFGLDFTSLEGFGGNSFFTFGGTIPLLRIDDTFCRRARFAGGGLSLASESSSLPESLHEFHSSSLEFSVSSSSISSFLSSEISVTGFSVGVAGILSIFCADATSFPSGGASFELFFVKKENKFFWPFTGALVLFDILYLPNLAKDLSQISKFPYPNLQAIPQFECSKDWKPTHRPLGVIRGGGRPHIDHVGKTW